MEQSTQTKTEEVAANGSDLFRPSDGRVLAGVSLGLARRFDLPVWVPRAFFIVCAFFGGLGIALYAAGWALMRSEDEDKSPLESFLGDSSSSRSWLGIGLIFIAALILIDNLTFLSGGVVWSVGLLVVGVLLYTGQIPIRGGSGDQAREGVQQMTEESTPETVVDGSAGDSSAGGPPPTPSPTPPMLPPEAARPKETSILGRLTLGIILVGMGVLAILDNISGIPIDASPRHYVALAVVLLGAGLIVGGFAGRARWLILIGVILVPTMLFSPLFEYDFESEEFNAAISPTQFESLDTTYTVDVGNLEIDLTRLPWDGQEVTLNAGVDLGNLEILVPEGVGIVGEADVDVGRVSAAGRESAGLGDPTLTFDERGRLGTVNLDAHVDVGNIEIRR